MGPNPLLPTEVRELADQLYFPLSAWTAELIYRLDDAVLKGWREDVSTPSKREPQQAELPVSDVAGLKAMMRATAERHRLIQQAKAQAMAQRAAKGGAK